MFFAKCFNTTTIAGIVLFATLLDLVYISHNDYNHDDYDNDECYVLKYEVIAHRFSLLVVEEFVRILAQN